MENTSNPNKNKPTQGKNNKPRTAAESLIDDVLSSNALLFHDQYHEAYIAQHGDGRQVLKLSSKAFAEWLAHSYWAKEQKPLPRDADKQVVQTLTAHARFESSTYPLQVRLARSGEELWYDLADGRAIRITSTEWTLVAKPPILFRRMQQKQQVEPEKDGVLDHLRNYVNLASDDDWLLFMVFVVAAFIPEFPHPLLILHGSQGSGKTTPMRVIKQLVDPSVIQGMPLPDKIPEFVQLADHHAFLFFDNLSNMPTKMSDALARASTGDSFSKRQLYTDSDDVLYTIQKTIALNGINQVITKADLLDRSILIKLQRITPELRMPEADFWAAFSYDKPSLLGAIFDVIVKALALYPDIELNEVPRMADFTRWGCAIAEAAGYGQDAFLKAYTDNIARQNDEAIDASPVAKAVISLMHDLEGTNVWQGTPEELLGTLNRRLDTINSSSSPLWPRAPEWMTRRLNEAQTNLSAIGIQVEIDRINGTRTITITIDEPVEEESPQDDSTDDPDSMSAQTVIL